MILEMIALNYIDKDPQTKREVRTTGIVPEGHVYVQFSAYSRAGKLLEPFYERARAVMAQRSAETKAE